MTGHMDKDESMSLASDNEIIRRVLEEGDSRLFSILVERYRKKISFKCNSILRDRDLAWEFSGDILSKVFENLKDFKGKSSFSTWVYTISYNYCIDYLRRKRKMHYPNWNMEHELPEIIDVEEEDLTELSYDQLVKILEMIHPEEKALLIMKYQDDIPLKQMANALRISESALKMRLQRAKARVLFLYKKHYKN